MKTPRSPAIDPLGYVHLEDQLYFDKEMAMWQEEINSLRTIPCSENNWKDGQEYEQDVDYKLEEKETKEIEDFSGSMNVPCYKTKLFAVPIVAQETEDELWKEVLDMFSEDTSNPFGSFEPLEKLLKSKFTIKRKL